MDAFTGEIRAFGFQFAPIDWMPCNGQSLLVQQYQALFAVIGITYGGNGQTNFQLPNIPAKVLNGQGTLTGGQTYNCGGTGGVENVTLTTTNMPAHTHNFNAAFVQGGASKEVTTPPASGSFVSNAFEKQGASFLAGRAYSNVTTLPDAYLNPLAITPNGGNGAHSNMMPFLVINYFICVNGIFPSRP